VLDWKQTVEDRVAIDPKVTGMNMSLVALGYNRRAASQNLPHFLRKAEDLMLYFAKS